MVKKTNKNEKYVELEISTNLYTEPDKDGKTTLIKKNIPVRLSVYISDIASHEEVCDNKGKILKGFCRIHHKDVGSIIVKKSYDKILELKTKDDKPTSNTIGFKYNKSK